MIVLQCLFSPACERLEQRDRSSASSTMLLINKRLRVGSHWYASESKSAYWLARVTLYCKQYYVTLMTHYTHHNNDVIIDVKTYWHPVLFSCRKRQKLLVFQGNLYSYTEPVLLWMAAIRIHANPDLYQCEPGLTGGDERKHQSLQPCTLFLAQGACHWLPPSLSAFSKKSPKKNSWQMSTKNQDEWQGFNIAIKGHFTARLDCAVFYVPSNTV